MAKLIDYNTLFKGYHRNDTARVWRRSSPEQMLVRDGETTMEVVAPADVIDALVVGMTEKRGWAADDADPTTLKPVAWPDDITLTPIGTGSVVGAWLYCDPANGRKDGRGGLMGATVIRDGALWLSDGHRLHKADIDCPSDAEYLFESGAFSALVRAWAVSPRSARIEIGHATEKKTTTHYARIVNGPIVVTLSRPFTERWSDSFVAVMSDASKVLGADSPYTVALTGHPDELRQAIKANEFELLKKTCAVAIVASKDGAWFVGENSEGARSMESPRVAMPVHAIAGADIVAHDDTLPVWVNSKYLIESIDSAAQLVTLYVAGPTDPVIVLHDGAVTSTGLIMPTRPPKNIPGERPSKVRADAAAKAEQEAAAAKAQAEREASADF